MPSLATMLRQTDEYPSYHPTVQTIFLGMAQAFDQDPSLLTKDTAELTQIYADTGHEQWRSFLSLPVVDRYIRGVLKFNAQIGFRKAQEALTLAASTGNTQAAKQITEISEILEQENTNRTVVLTYVPRPSQTTPTDPLGSLAPIEDADLDLTINEILGSDN